MKRIILTDEGDETISFNSIGERGPIFAKNECGEIAGMVRHEKNGWVLAISSVGGSCGYHETLRECLESGIEYDYEFFI